MAYAVFVGDGRALDYTPSANVAAGDVVVLADVVGVARTPIVANTPGSLAVSGLFDFAKATGAGSGIAVGTKVYWDAADKVATASANNGATPPVAYAYLGKVAKAAADADTTVRVRLSQ